MFKHFVVKGNATVVLNTEDYNNKRIEHLSCGSYQQLSKYPSNKIHKTVYNAIMNSKLDEGLKKKLLPKEGNAPLESTDF